MVAMTKAVRFILPGTTGIKFVPTSTNYKSMLLTELNAGTDIIDLAEVAGWSVTSNNIDAPDFDSLFTSKVAGLTSAEDSSLTFYGSKTGADVRAVLPRGTTGFLAFADGGFDSDNTFMDVFPITVSSVAKQRSQSDTFKIQVSFAITAEPDEDQTIPTV